MITGISLRIFFVRQLETNVLETLAFAISIIVEGGKGIFAFSPFAPGNGRLMRESLCTTTGQTGTKSQ